MSVKTQLNQSKSNVLLTELVIVILFFALTAATAMQLFIGSYLKSKNNTVTQEAYIIGQNLVEQLRGVEDVVGFLTEQGFEVEDDGGYMLNFDHNTLVYAEVGEEQLAGGTLHYCKLSVDEVNDKVDALCTLSVATYVPAEEVAN